MISSIVVNYRTSQDLDSFCRWYDGSSGDELFIINVSPEAVDEKVAEGWARQLNAHYFAFDENVGYAKAVNQASAWAEGDVLAIFNADVELRPGALHRCAEALRLNEDWGVLGPLQVDRQGLCTHPGIFGTQREPQWRLGGWRKPVQPFWREVRTDAVTVMGSAYFVKRSVWDELHQCPVYRSIDPDSKGAFLQTQLYYEETWCSYHTTAHGYKVVYYGIEEIIHDWHAAIKKVDSWASKQFVISRNLFREACEAHGIQHD